MISMQNKGHIKLIDFGFSKQLAGPADRTYTKCGTPAYIAPEIIKGQEHGLEVDIWSFGVLIYEMLVGKTPFNDSSPALIYKNVIKGTVSFPSFISIQARDLLQQILVTDPGSRPSFSQIKEHAFFSGIDWSMSLSERYKKESAPFVPDAPSFNLDQNTNGKIENTFEPEKHTEVNQEFTMNPQYYQTYLNQNQQNQSQNPREKPNTNASRRRQKPLGDFIFKKINIYF